MTERDNLIATLKVIGLQPHVINKILKDHVFSNETSKELVKYARDICGVEEHILTYTLFIAAVNTVEELLNDNKIIEALIQIFGMVTVLDKLKTQIVEAIAKRESN